MLAHIFESHHGRPYFRLPFVIVTILWNASTWHAIYECMQFWGGARPWDPPGIHVEERIKSKSSNGRSMYMKVKTTVAWVASGHTMKEPTLDIIIPLQEAEKWLGKRMLGPNLRALQHQYPCSSKRESCKQMALGLFFLPGISRPCFTTIIYAACAEEIQQKMQITQYK